MTDIRWYDGKVDMADLSERLRVRRESGIQIESLQSVPHYHVAQYVDGKLVDDCAKCGLDLRNPVHFRWPTIKGQKYY